MRIAWSKGSRKRKVGAGISRKKFFKSCSNKNNCYDSDELVTSRVRKETRHLRGGRQRERMGGGMKTPVNGIFLETTDMETVDPLCSMSRARSRQAEAILKIAPSGTKRRPRPEGLNRLLRIVEHSGISSYTSRGSTTRSLLSRSTVLLCIPSGSKV